MHHICSRVALLLLLGEVPFAAALASSEGDGCYPVSWCQAAVIRVDAPERQTPGPVPLVSIGRLSDTDWKQLQDPMHGPLGALTTPRLGAQWGPWPTLGISDLAVARLRGALLPIPAGPRRQTLAILTGGCWAGAWRPTALQVHAHELEISVMVMPDFGPCPASPPRLVYLLDLQRIDPQLTAISLHAECFEAPREAQGPPGYRRSEVASGHAALDPAIQQPVALITADGLHRIAALLPPGAAAPLMPRVLTLTMRDGPGVQEGLIGIRQLDLRTIDPVAVVAAPPESIDDGPGYREACAVVVSPPLHQGEWMSLAHEGLILHQVHLECEYWRDDASRGGPLHREVLLIPLPEATPADGVQLTTTWLVRAGSLYDEVHL